MSNFSLAQRVLACALCLCFSGFTSAISSGELQALRDLYESTAGPHWLWNDGVPWNFSSPSADPCRERWAYIHCDNENVTVLSLETSDEGINMSGTLPDSLSRLMSMGTLIITNNVGLYGSIPPSLGSLQNLSVLDLSLNSLSGSFPSTLYDAPLVYLDLNGNPLSGSLPDSFSASPWTQSMQTLIVGNNLLTGTFPAFFCSLAQLQELDISFSYLNDSLPACINSLIALRTLYLNANEFTGTTPKEFADLSLLEVLDLSYNQLSGSLPSSILSSLPSLMALALKSNFLTGTIPPALEQLSNLVVLDLSSNSFSGSFPQTLFGAPLVFLNLNDNSLTGTLPELFVDSPWTQSTRVFLVFGNSLTGTFPSSFCSLSSLETLDMRRSSLNGSLPSCLSSLAALRVLYLGNNRFTGTIPKELTDLSLLENIDLSHNQLSGSLPSSILLSMSAVQSLLLGSNKLTGTIPSFPDFTVLSYELDIEDNFFTSTLPQSAFDAPSYYIFFIFSGNLFSGPIPSFMFNTSCLFITYLNSNLLTGSIPDDSWSSCRLKEFVLTENYLTGSLPESLSLCPFLRHLSIGFNFLSSSLPASLPNLNTFSLNDNMITGALPASISTLSFVELINAGNNLLSGHVAGMFQNAIYLQALVLQNNKFSGSIDDLLSPRMFDIKLIDISVNELSGTIPRSWFLVERLISLSAVKNCISGSLPEEICLVNRTLTNLALDGLYAAESCRRRIFEPIRTYNLVHPLSGTIPSCLFTDFPRLQTLQLGGNGMRGSFPSELASISPSLEKLSLSHNSLTGTIPLSIQQHPWKSLDLSFNRFTGDLSSPLLSSIYARNDSSLALRINRLSGDIPASLRSAPNVDILTGNIFYCDADRSQLPVHDPSHDSYECGSNSVNNALYGWLVVASLMVWIGMSIYFRKHIFPRAWAMCEGAMIIQVEIKSLLEEEESQGKEKGKEDSVKEQESGIKLTDDDPRECPSERVRERERELAEKFQKSARDVLNKSANVNNVVHVVVDDYTLVLERNDASRTKGIEDGTEVCDTGSCDERKDVEFSSPSPSPSPSLSSSSWSVTVLPPKIFGARFVRAMNIFERRLLSFWEIYSSAAAARFYDLPLEELNGLGILYRELRHWVFRCTLLIVAVFLPLNIVLSKRFGVYKSAYAWTLSFGFTAGETPVITVMVFLGVFLFVLFCRPLSESAFRTNRLSIYCLLTSTALNDCKVHQTNESQSKPSSIVDDHRGTKERENDNVDNFSARILWLARIFALLLLNCAVVLAVNMGYVYLVSNSTNGNVKKVVTISVSIYKLIWNKFTMFAFELIKANKSAELRPMRKSMQTNDSGYSVFAVNMVWLSIFNNIIAPFIATAFISHDCFYYAIYPAPEAESSSGAGACFYMMSKLMCFSWLSTVSYSPPFMYSYLCSAALLSSFAEIFLYRFIIGSILLPVLHLMVKYLQERVFLKCEREHTTLYRFLTMMLPPLLRPLALLPVEEPSVFFGVQKKFVNLEGTMITLITDVAILLTFGVMFPPLAVVGCVSILTSTCFFQLQLGRVVVLARSQRHLQVYLEHIGAECGGIRGLLVHSLKSLAVLLSLFWSLFLFDGWGYEHGAGNSWWVFVVMVSIPGLIGLVNAFFDGTKKNKKIIIEEGEFGRSHPSLSSRELNEKEILPTVYGGNKHEDDIGSIELTPNPLHCKTPIPLNI